MARILVVDDVDVVRLVICKILKRAGHSSEQAGSGAEALALVRTRAPDAVVTDLWMPGSDGFGLIRVLQSEFPAVAVVAMTAGSPHYSMETSLNDARRAGAVQVLMKPVDRAELVNAVEQAMRDAVPVKGQYT
jgi:CheY-like chemotaxis protein